MLLQRLFILVALTATPLLGLLALREASEYQGRRADVNDSALAAAQIVAAEQERLLTGAQILLTGLARLPAIRERQRSTCHGILADLMPRLADYGGVMVYDRDGESFCSSLPAGSINAADRDYFREAMDGARFTVGALTRGRIGDRFLIPAALPFEGRDGRPAGVIAVSIPVERLVPIPMPTSSTAFVIADRNGQIVFGPRMKTWFGNTLPSPLMAVLTAPGPGTLEARDPDGEMRIWGYLPLSSSRSGLFVAAGMPLSIALAPMHDAVLRSAIVGSLAIALAFAAAYWGGWHFIRRPIMRLLQAAEAWRPGEPVSVPAIGPPRHEFQRIASALASLETRTNELLRHREFLVRELQHRVMNTLQILSSFLGLQALRSPTPEAQAALADAQHRVSAIAAVYQRLYQHAQATDVDFASFLAALARDLGTAYCGQEGENLLKLDVEPCRVTPGATITIATIVTEAVTNAIKYARRDGVAPLLILRCARAPDGWRIEIADNGPGLPAGFDPAASKSLGLLVINRMITQLDGTAEFVSSENGLTVRLNLPPEFARSERRALHEDGREYRGEERRRRMTRAAHI